MEMRVDSGELMAVTTISLPLFLGQPPWAIYSFPYFNLCTHEQQNKLGWLLQHKKIHTHANTYTQMVLKHHQPTNITSTCQWEPQVCDPVWIFFFQTPLLLDPIYWSTSIQSIQPVMHYTCAVWVSMCPCTSSAVLIDMQWALAAVKLCVHAYVCAYVHVCVYISQ